MVRKSLLFFLGCLLFLVATFSSIMTLQLFSFSETMDWNMNEDIKLEETYQVSNYFYEQTISIMNQFGLRAYPWVDSKEVKADFNADVYTDLDYMIIEPSTQKVIKSNMVGDNFNQGDYLLYYQVNLDTFELNSNSIRIQPDIHVKDRMIQIGLSTNDNYVQSLKSDIQTLLKYKELKWGIFLWFPAFIIGILFLVDYGKTSTNNFFSKIPFEIAFFPILMIVTSVLFGWKNYSSVFWIYHNIPAFIYTVLTTFVLFVLMLLGMGLLLYLITNIKYETLFKNSLIGRITHGLGQVFSSLSSNFKITFIAVLLFMAHILIPTMHHSWVFMFLFAGLLAVDVYLLSQLIKHIGQQEEINQSIANIRAGSLQEINKDEFFPFFHQEIDDINHLKEGLQEAVEKSLKEERLSLDLISNVSHDIKTPITSILNYVQLIIDQENPDKHDEYLQIIKEKALRLADLSRDVVEASKASSGKMEIELVNLNALELLNQVLVDHQTKFESKGLSLLIDEPSIDYQVSADSQKLYRVYENLFVNIEKYALANTRVYIEGKLMEDELIISFKNVSASQLGSEDLTARFVQGEKSRVQEGNGLGLAIAKDLMRLQNGKLWLEIDGDLFKVNLKLKTVK